MVQANHQQLLETTESLCPICLKVVEAQIVNQDNVIYQKKVCPDHGPTTTQIWPDASHYRWMNAFRVPFKQVHSDMDVHLGCPSDCGLCKQHLRHTTLVEFEITQRCNLRCPVCFMSADAAPLDPSLPVIAEVFQSIIKQAGSQCSLQITGGEPTVRQDLVEIIHLAKQTGFEAIEVNTNGVVIGSDPQFIQSLAQAGISGIYLQFDGLTKQAYQKIRGRDLLDTKLQVIEHCRSAGVQVVLAMTVIWGITHHEMGMVLDFALRNQDIIAGVAFQPAFMSGRFDVTSGRRLSMGDVVFMLSEQSQGLIQPYDLWPLSCSHPLCSCSTYLVNHYGNITPFTRLISPQEYIQSFDTHSPQGSVFADIAANKFPGLDKGLSVVVMNYMDAMNIDIKRLKECSMTVAMEDSRLIPFCIYQLTNCHGKRLYPIWGRDSGIHELEETYGCG